MIYIKTLKIQNFQSHKDTYIDFNKGLNVIVGPSDNGKTAIIRAIKWVLYNEPRGMNFLKQGEKKVKVKVVLSNNFKVTRERTKSKNRYILEDDKGNESIFEGFGNEVPLEVTKAHGIPKMKIDSDINSIINIGEQLESPFLLSESGAVRAKAIGRLSGVHIIDRAVRNSIRDNRKYSRLKDNLMEDLNNLNNELLKYNYLEQYLNKINKTEYKLDKLDSLTLKLKSLEDLSDKYINNIIENKENSKCIEGLKYINRCEDITERLDDKAFRLVNYRFLNDNLKKVKKEINYTERVLKLTDCIKISENNLKVIDKKVFKYNKLIDCLKKYKTISYEYKLNLERIDKTEKISKLPIGEDLTFKLEKYYNFLSLRKEYINILKKIESMDKYKSSLNDVEKKEKILKKVIDKTNKYDNLNEINSSYIKNEKSLKDGNKYIKKNVENIEKLLNEYKKILNVMKKCPLCLSLIDEDKIKNIINLYREEQYIE